MASEVYLNGKFVGTTENSTDFVKHLIAERRKGSVSQNLNVFHDKRSGEVHINTSKGRARRPLIIAKDGNPLLTDVHIKQLQKNEITF